MTALRKVLGEGLSAAETYPGSTGRKLLQYYGNNYNCDYYGNCNYWSGGRIAGVVIGCVLFALAVFFAILACTIRRRRMARYQTNNAYPAGTYPAAQPAQPAPYQTNQYPQANPNQAYPQNTGGYNPAPYNAGGGHPNIATGTPANEYNGVQMSALPHEKPGYQANV